MDIINRYILKELLKIFLLTVCFLTMILFLDKALFLTGLIINRGVTLFEVIRMMVYISPAFLALTLPIGVLAASIVVFSQMSADSEWVAMKANGWSFLNLMKPVVYFSLLAYVLTNLVMFYALPWGNQSFKRLIFDIIQSRANFEIKPNVFNTDFDNLVLLIKERKNRSVFKHVFISDNNDPKAQKIIVADEALIIANTELLKIQLQLKNGTIHDLGEKRTHYQLLNFDRYDLTLDLPSTRRLKRKAMLGNRELSYKDLLKKIERYKSEGRKTSKVEVEVSKKFSIPFTCLIFGLFGAPLGIKSSRSGKSGSYTVATIAIAVYYVGFISMQNIGSLGKVNPYISVWVPNILFFIIMLYMVIKMQKEIPFKILEKIQSLIETLIEFLKIKYQKYLEPEKTLP